MTYMRSIYDLLKPYVSKMLWATCAISAVWTAIVGRTTQTNTHKYNNTYINIMCDDSLAAKYRIRDIAGGFVKD